MWYQCLQSIYQIHSIRCFINLIFVQPLAILVWWYDIACNFNLYSIRYTNGSNDIRLQPSLLLFGPSTINTWIHYFLLIDIHIGSLLLHYCQHRQCEDLTDTNTSTHLHWRCLAWIEIMMFQDITVMIRHEHRTPVPYLKWYWSNLSRI